MLKAIAPLLIAFGALAVAPAGAAADGFVLDTGCRRVSVSVVKDLEPGLTVCPTGS